jgi:hypothetical protein
VKFNPKEFQTYANNFDAKNQALHLSIVEHIVSLSETNFLGVYTNIFKEVTRGFTHHFEGV